MFQNIKPLFLRLFLLQVHSFIFPLAKYQGVSKITASNYKMADYSYEFTLYILQQ